MSEVNKKIISLEVRGEYILGSGVSIGAEGSFDSVYLRVKFDEHWLGLNIYATWQDALGNVGDQQIFVTALDLVDGEPNTYDIPVTQFVTNYPGTVRLALSGYAIGGEAGNEIESLTNTVSGAFRVLESGATRLDSGNVNATLAEQLLSKVNDAIRGEEERQAEFDNNEQVRTTQFEAAEKKRQDTFDENESARQADYEAWYDDLDIVQDVGDSESAVMSQKATTDLAKMITKYVDETYSVETCEKKDTSLNLDGSARNNINFCTTGYIPINENSTIKSKAYIYVNSAVLAVAYYAENKEFLEGISWSGDGNNGTLQIDTKPPALAKFVRFCFLKSRTQDQIRVATWHKAATEEDVREIHKEVLLAEDIVQEAGDSQSKVMSQKATTDFAKAYIPKAATRNLFNVDDFTPASINQSTGQITMNDPYLVSTINGIPVVGGQTYTLSWSGGDQYNNEYGYFYISMYKSDNSYIGNYSQTVAATPKYYKCVLDAECAFVRFMFYKHVLPKIDKLQFEEGDTATEYISPESIDNSLIDLVGHPDASKFARADDIINPTAYGLPILELFGNPSAMNASKNEVDFTYKYTSVSRNYSNFTYNYGEPREGTCTLKWQGNSSLAFPKKNYTVKFDTKFEAKSGWGEQKKYCLKANYIDFSHSRNISGARLWGEVVKSRTPANGTLNALPNKGAIDGFPICLMMNGKYQGLYTFNIPKDKWMFGMGDGAAEAIVCADRSDRDSCMFKALAEFNGDFEIEHAPDENNTEWIKTSLNRLLQACIDCNSTEDFDNNVAPYLDVESAIDYLIHLLVIGHWDGMVKNYILSTYDGTKWFFTAYDMDTTFGLNWNASTIYSEKNTILQFEYITSCNRLFTLLKTHKKDKLKTRYNELIKNALRVDNVVETIAKSTASIPKAIYDKEVTIWKEIPGTSVNNFAQMVDFYRIRREYIDAKIEAL